MTPEEVRWLTATLDDPPEVIVEALARQPVLTVVHIVTLARAA